MGLLAKGKPACGSKILRGIVLWMLLLPYLGYHGHHYFKRLEAGLSLQGVQARRITANVRHGHHGRAQGGEAMGSKNMPLGAYRMHKDATSKNKPGARDHDLAPEGVSRISGICPEAGRFCAQDIESAILKTGMYDCTRFFGTPELIGTCNWCTAGVCHDSEGMGPVPAFHFVDMFKEGGPPSFHWVTCPAAGKFCGAAFEKPDSTPVLRAAEIWGLPSAMQPENVYMCKRTGVPPVLLKVCSKDLPCSSRDVVNKADDADCTTAP